MLVRQMESNLSRAKFHVPYYTQNAQTRAKNMDFSEMSGRTSASNPIQFGNAGKRLVSICHTYVFEFG